jgi:outer membrane protein
MWITTALASGAQALDLTEAWRAAALHDPEFAAARAAHEAGLARRTQAGALWRPNIQLESGVGRASIENATRGAAFSAPGLGASGGVAFDTSVTSGTSTRVALAVRQPLVDREREAQSRQLEIAADVAELEWLDAQQALKLRSSERYFDAALAAEQLRLLTRQTAAVDQALLEAQDRFRIGDRPVTDTHEAAARAASLASRRLAAETELELKRVALADLVGPQPVGVPLPLPTAPVRVDDVGVLADWLAQARQRNPALGVAEARLRAARQEQNKTSTALSPSLDLVAHIGRERLSGTGDFGGASNTSNNRAVGVQLAVPLYTGGWRSARQIEARALVDKAHADVERARQQVALQTRSAWLELAVGSGRQAALSSAALASQARLDATRVGLRAGDRTTQELLDAENDAAAADLALMQARVQLLTNRLRLSALAGQLDETHLSQIDAALRARR